MWAKVFEKLEAVVYNQTTTSEDTSGVEARRLREAVDAATTTVQTSSGLLHKFMSKSGGPAISETFCEIQMEAATLLGARNDATRGAAKAKEAVEMVASKQGLAKDPAAVTAANQLFAHPYTNPGRKVYPKPTIGSSETSKFQHRGNTNQQKPRKWNPCRNNPRNPRADRDKDKAGRQRVRQQPHQRCNRLSKRLPGLQYQQLH